MNAIEALEELYHTHVNHCFGFTHDKDDVREFFTSKVIQSVESILIENGSDEPAKYHKFYGYVG